MVIRGLSTGKGETWKGQTLGVWAGEATACKLEKAWKGWDTREGRQRVIWGPSLGLAGNIEEKEDCGEMAREAAPERGSLGGEAGESRAGLVSPGWTTTGASLP